MLDSKVSPEEIAASFTKTFVWQKHVLKKLDFLYYFNAYIVFKIAFQTVSSVLLQITPLRVYTRTYMLIWVVSQYSILLNNDAKQWCMLNSIKDENETFDKS